MNENGAILSMKGISKSFGPVQALDGVDLDVRPGEVLALVGDNGAGKSTLVKSISGIYTIDSGEFSFEGQPVTISGPARRPNSGSRPSTRTSRSATTSTSSPTSSSARRS